ncbi:adhesion G protein-coupled receptor L2-like isoform X2 [Apostichopus japonicus]|uniref:adhesion G protein-coupled receptor L2-like isoform X2 n=1 Tax=Stichopus japonicus TaxID=307972 RepID=UPI003AB3C3EE
MIKKRRGRKLRKMESVNILRCIILISGIAAIKAEMNSTVSSCDSSFYGPPVCINTPGPYVCQCAPGFLWNGNFCMANAVNSKLVFPRNSTTNNYVELLGKSFPELKSFTIALWVNFSSEMLSRNITLVSYRKTSTQIKFSGGFAFKLVVADQEVLSPTLKITPGSWTHLAITWKAEDGSWATYSEGKIRDSGVDLSPGHSIDSGGELVIGNPPEGEIRSASPLGMMNFVGDMGQVHVWGESYSERQIWHIYNDCTFSDCGNIVEWTDFRSGTRGDVKLIWHSHIFEYCGIDRVTSCDKSCTQTLGPKCVLGYEGNLEWPRTTVGTTVELPCPTLRGDGKATRTCLPIKKETVGKWGPVDVSNCVTGDLLVIKHEIQEVLISDKKRNIQTEVSLLKNMTKLIRHMSKVTNPSDLVTIIDVIDMLVQVQKRAVDLNSWTERKRSHTDVMSHPSIADTLEFSEELLGLVDSILYGAFDSAWNATQPRGYEALRLLEVIDRFSAMLVRSLMGHVTRNEISLSSALAGFDLNTIALFVRLSDRSELISDITLPDHFKDFKIMQVNQWNGALEKGVGRMKIPEYIGFDDVKNKSDDIIGYSFVKLTSMSWLLPNHPEQVVVQFYRDKHLAFAHRENNVNTPILTFSVFDSAGEILEVPASSSEPLIFELGFLNTFNISNASCQHLNRTVGSLVDWSWTSEGCFVRPPVDYDEKAICECHHVGVFAITTHMYDVNWDPGEPPRFFPRFPMFIGCAVSITFFAVSLGTFFYFRCVTDTVAVHRNLAVSEILLQLTFLIGTPRIENALICKIITILIHFLFVTSFGWICNEAFNLYVEVANSIHSEHQQQRPMLRYYVIGWFAPGILVGVLANTNWNDYFSSNVCFMDFSFVWFMIGPAAGIWGITVFVLIYTGKDISESSYFKDEKTNKVITNHCKGCWIQIMLIVITWSFALFSVDMLSIIPQILFAMFDMLQGAFFFTFFCCLNGEVTEAINDYRMGMTQTSGLQRTTRYSIYRRYVPRPTTRRTLSNQSGGSSGASQTPRRNSLNSEHAEEESDIPLTNKNQSLREHVLRSSVDKMRLLRRGGNVTFDESTDEDHRTKEEEIEDSSIKEEVTYCSDQSKDLVTAV